MEDRRSFARIDHQHLVSYTQRTPSESPDEGMAKTLNLSAHGLLLLLPHDVAVGALLQLELNLDGSIVEVGGTAVRVAPSADSEGMFDVGVDLAHVPEEFSETVSRYLAKVETTEL